MYTRVPRYGHTKFSMSDRVYTAVPVRYRGTYAVCTHSSVYTHGVELLVIHSNIGGFDRKTFLEASKAVSGFSNASVRHEPTRVTVPYGYGRLIWVI